MRASHRWLAELSGVDAPADEVAERLTGAGLEVEAIERIGTGLDRVVVAEVRKCDKVPEKDKLSLVTVFDGEGETTVICGAPNVPAPGGRVLFARVGAELPNGMSIGERKIAGVVSRGMICSETELHLGEDTSGIIVLSDNEPSKPGTALSDALPVADAVFEIGLTPNRPDGLGHVGLAREVALAFGVPFSMPAIPAPSRWLAGEDVVGDGPRLDLGELVAAGGEVHDATDAVQAALDGHRARVTIADPDRCPRYGAALVFGLSMGPSPFWLRFRLHCLGVRSLGSLVDATNLVMLENGHPIHGFDLRRVRGRRIDVRCAREGEKMPTLDGIERTFTTDDLLICDGDGPVAVAGVMGGENSEIGQDTTDVLIECAYFDPRSIRRTSRRLGLHTDASHRFERGVDPNGVPRVLARAAQLLAELGGGVVAPGALDVNPKPVARATVSLRLSRTTKLLGFETPRARVVEILSGIGCDVDSGTDEDVLTVRAPTWRPDIGREVDLIEEVARVRGFDHIPTEVPHVRPSKEGTPRHIRFDRELRRAAAASGLTECVTYAFVSERELSAARVSTDAVRLSNPLSEERTVMRTSLLPGLAAAALRAQRHQVASAALFEVGHVFDPSGEVLPRERALLSMLLVGPRPAWIGEGAPYDFYDGKGWIEQLLSATVGGEAVFRISDAPPGWAHPRRVAEISIAGRTVGTLAELHPEVGEALELTGRPIHAELEVEAMLAAAESLGVPQARPLPRFPSVFRDISLSLPEEHQARAVAEALAEAGGSLVEAVRLADLYRGEQVEPGHKSLTFRVVYRDPGSTLTDKKVDKIHRKLAETAKNRFSAALRE